MGLRRSEVRVKEEGGWEYVSDHQHGEAGAHEPHPEAAALYQPLGEAASGELAERGQTEHGQRSRRQR